MKFEIDEKLLNQVAQMIFNGVHTCPYAQVQQILKQLTELKPIEEPKRKESKDADRN